jgi:glycosyltransferase involved in cell wall biosynthesis
VRLLVVTQYFWPEDFRINELVAELVARGHAITVLTGVPNYPSGQVFPAYRSNPDAFSLYRDARVIRVPMATRGQGRARLLLNYVSFAASATIAGMLRLRDERFDAIFVFEPSPVTVGLPAITFRTFRKWPVAFWVLDQWPETLSAVGVLRSKLLIRLIGRLVSFIYDRCDLVLGQSKALTELIAQYCHDPARIRYFPNWVEGGYGPAAMDPADEIPRLSGVFNVMFAGNIGESQDFPAILDAAERLKSRGDIRWLIVGDGRMAAWLKDEVKRRGLNEHFCLLGRYPIERMPSFFAHAHALLVSLKRDPVFSLTIPGKLQSYLASGIPVLGMLDGEGARTIVEARAGLAAPAGDGSRLAENVSRMMMMTPGERRTMGENGRAYAKREFDRETLITNLEEMLSGIAEHRDLEVTT